jgi:integrase
MPREPIPSDPRGQADVWLARVERRNSATTHRIYAWTIHKLADHLGGAAWCDVTTEDLEEFLDRPRDTVSGKPSKATVSRDMAILRSFFTWLDQQRLLSPSEPNPIVDVEPARGLSKPRRDPLPDEVWLAIWESEFVSSDDRLWLGLGYFCGLRRAELASISPQSVFARNGDAGSGSLRMFTRKGGKDGNGIAYAAIIRTLSRPEPHGLPHLVRGGEAWMDLLEASATFRADMPFLVASSEGNPAHDPEADGRRLYDRFRYIQERVGVPASELVGIHTLRHSAATNLARCGVPKDMIRRQLSHSSEEMTDHYINGAMLMDRWLDQVNPAS